MKRWAEVEQGEVASMEQQAVTESGRFWIPGVIRQSWQAYRNNGKILLAGMFVFLLVGILLNASVLFAFAAGPLLLGCLRLQLKIVRGGKGGISDVFYGFNRIHFVPFVLFPVYLLLISMLIVSAAAPILWFNATLVGAGPGVILVLSLCLASPWLAGLCVVPLYCMADAETSAWKAWKSGWALAKGDLLQWGLLGLLTWVALLASAGLSIYGLVHGSMPLVLLGLAPVCAACPMGLLVLACAYDRAVRLRNAVRRPFGEALRPGATRKSKLLHNKYYDIWTENCSMPKIIEYLVFFFVLLLEAFAFVAFDPLDGWIWSLLCVSGLLTGVVLLRRACTTGPEGEFDAKGELKRIRSIGYWVAGVAAAPVLLVTCAVSTGESSRQPVAVLSAATAAVIPPVNPQSQSVPDDRSSRPSPPAAVVVASRPPSDPQDQRPAVVRRPAPGMLVFKGLYLGMDIHEACNVLDRAIEIEYAAEEPAYDDATLPARTVFSINGRVNGQSIPIDWVVVHRTGKLALEWRVFSSAIPDLRERIEHHYRDSENTEQAIALAVEELNQDSCIWRIGPPEKTGRDLRSDALILHIDNMLRISADSSGVVHHIELEPELSNAWFNAYDLSAEAFTQRFIQAYDIPSLEATAMVEAPNPFLPFETAALPMNWVYLSPKGFRLSISQSKSLAVTMLAKASEASFD